VLVEAAKAKAAERKVEAGKVHGRGQRNRSSSKDDKLSKKRTEPWHKHLAARMGVSEATIYRMDLVLNKQPNETLKGWVRAGVIGGYAGYSLRAIIAVTNDAAKALAKLDAKEAQEKQKFGRGVTPGCSNPELEDEPEGRWFERLANMFFVSPTVIKRAEYEGMGLTYDNIGEAIGMSGRFANLLLQYNRFLPFGTVVPKINERKFRAYWAETSDPLHLYYLYRCTGAQPRIE